MAFRVIAYQAILILLIHNQPFAQHDAVLGFVIEFFIHADHRVIVFAHHDIELRAATGDEFFLEAADQRIGKANLSSGVNWG